MLSTKWTEPLFSVKGGRSPCSSLKVGEVIVVHQFGGQNHFSPSKVDETTFSPLISGRGHFFFFTLSVDEATVFSFKCFIRLVRTKAIPICKNTIIPFMSPQYTLIQHATKKKYISIKGIDKALFSLKMGEPAGLHEGWRNPL